MLFGKKLTTLRETKGWTKKELAKRAGVSEQVLGQWESDQRVPAAPGLFALCAALGVSSEVFAKCQFPARRAQKTAKKP